MAGPYTHGKKTYVGIRASGGGAFTNISGYVKTSTLPFNREEHDTTTYGTDTAKTFQGGNTDRTFDMSGLWNPTFAAIIEPLAAADSIDLQWGKEGNGSGKANKTVTGFFTKYEDPADANDIGQWSGSVRVSGPVTDGTFA
jgi:hypothetical protein